MPAHGSILHIIFELWIMGLPSKYRRTGLLMIFSLVLLCSFTIYWLSGQFRQAKEELIKDLHANYKLSRGLVLDSLLHRSFIDPLLNDSSVNIFQVRKSPDLYFKADTVRVVGYSNVASKAGNGNSVVTVGLSSEEDTSGLYTDEKRDELEQEMMLRSIRLVVEHIEDSTGNHAGSFHGINSQLDSGLFIKDFNARLLADNIHVNPVWIGNDEASDSSKRIVIIGGWDHNLPVAEIRNYRSYILGKVLPQILFSLFLLLVTALAFWLAWSGILKQFRLNEMRNSFISNISHELKTPVSTVRVALEAIRKYDLKEQPDKADEYLEMSVKEVNRLEQLVKKVLDNSIIESGKIITQKKTVDLGDLLQQTVTSMHPKIEQTGAEMNIYLSDEIYVEADPVYLQGVFTNIIDNSLKYAGHAPELNVELAREGNFALVYFRDNGPGIPLEYRKRIFDKFFRIPTKDIHNVKGYGLGLSFASLVVSLHNGSISVVNGGKGCTFVIKLPLKSA